MSNEVLSMWAADALAWCRGRGWSATVVAEDEDTGWVSLTAMDGSDALYTLEREEDGWWSVQVEVDCDVASFSATGCGTTLDAALAEMREAAQKVAVAAGKVGR